MKNVLYTISWLTQTSGQMNLLVYFLPNLVTYNIPAKFEYNYKTIIKNHPRHNLFLVYR